MEVRTNETIFKVSFSLNFFLLKSTLKVSLRRIVGCDLYFLLSVLKHFRWCRIIRVKSLRTGFSFDQNLWDEE